VLGKRIEESFICTILNLLKNQGIKTIRAQYIPTPKNALVNCFYDQIGFSCIADNDGIKEYEANWETLDLVIKDYHHVVLHQNGR
jgi:predicted enzyme involved in methoxymalonyl-ACP biosynthesis